MKSHARVIVIGGGIVGCSILYHLAKCGLTDLILLERKELTSGSSWHAAGSLFALTRPAAARVLQKYTIDLYPALEQESEQPLGFHRTGGLSLACSEEELLTLRIARDEGRRNNIESEFITVAEALDMAPILSDSGIKGVLFEPSRGHVDPASATQAFAKAARKLGADIYRQTPVIATKARPQGGWDVVTPNGTIHADCIVNAAGLWAREVAELAGIALPLVPVEHHYIVTETVPEIAGSARRLPSISDSEAEFYSRQEGLGMLVGAYERDCKLWAIDRTPDNFGHELLPNDLARISDNLGRAMERMPALSRVGIKTVLNGPMIFSPDLNPLIGPHPELKNYYCACGVMTGFNQGGGIGRILAEWITEGEPSMDVMAWDVARFGRWAGRDFTRERAKFFYENRHHRAYPHEEFSVGRPIGKSDIHDFLVARNCVFGFSFGQEYPLWFAQDPNNARDIPSFRRANWFGPVGEECLAVRSGAGLFEISTFAKFEVLGPKAEAWLDRLMSNTVPATVGRTVLSPMLSPKGKIVGDFTITCLAPDRYWLIGAGSMQDFYSRWFFLNAPADGVQVRNVSTEYAGLHVAGPNARAIVSRLVGETLGSNVMPFLHGREFRIQGGQITVVRVSFTGELGYELYCRRDLQPAIFSRLMEIGGKFDLRLAGSRALMSLRMEKGFPSWGSDLSPDLTPAEANLERYVKMKKPYFIGREAVAAAAPTKIRRTTVVVDSDGADPVGGEPIFCGDQYIGYISSGSYGHCVKASIGMAYIDTDFVDADAAITVIMLGQKRSAKVNREALFDPTGVRMRS